MLFLEPPRYLTTSFILCRAALVSSALHALLVAVPPRLNHHALLHGNRQNLSDTDCRVRRQQGVRAAAKA